MKPEHLSSFAVLAVALAAMTTPMIMYGCGSAPLNTETSSSGIQVVQEPGANVTPRASVQPDFTREHNNVQKFNSNDVGYKDTDICPEMMQNDFAKSTAKLAEPDNDDFATYSRLNEENSVRVERNRRLQHTMRSLAALATVTHESRGLVISFSGIDFFMPDDSGLMPLARREMNIVFDVMRATPACRVCVTAFMDGQNDDDANMILSLRHASIVQEYLIQQGYAPELITARAMNETFPAAGGDAAEMRATNGRRIEIVIEHQQTVSPAKNQKP